MKLAVLALCLMFASGMSSVYLSTIPVHAQAAPQGPPPGMEPVPISSEERAKLDGPNKDYQMAQKDAELARLRFQLALNEIRTAHKFGDDVQFDGNSLSFFRVIKAAKPVDTKPAEKK